MDIQKNKRRKTEGILKIRDDFYVNMSKIDNIELIDEHPTSNSKLDPPKYCIRYKDSYYNWSLVTIDDFKKYIEPYI